MSLVVSKYFVALQTNPKALYNHNPTTPDTIFSTQCNHGRLVRESQTTSEGSRTASSFDVEPHGPWAMATARTEIMKREDKLERQGGGGRSKAASRRVLSCTWNDPGKGAKK
ncbi:hypothetical protein M758_4G058000 [Ceratodon purpureus]|uniref:Uncharacterized protein n=1 Tax=Ceratodon purpureus TaxID=3225 RepID=A0A8T0I798_CERPU|nr:hypothetical protein KC19_4G060500 [Ceratodon purpureus]KAG0618368.1 hypothetical protein M758_4G058000 [Ceratodon purpureus]